MKILVLNGSPKGEHSITLQTLLYLQKKCPGHSWEILHVGRKIKALEKDFSPALTALHRADLVVFSYPVYTFLAPSQLHRFIELMKEHGADVAEKLCTQVTTSKHFYDITAHRYVQDNAQEMGMYFLPGLSADMEDLTTRQGQQEAVKWWEHILWAMEKGYFAPCYLPDPEAGPQKPRQSVEPLPQDSREKPGDVVIIADLREGDAQLAKMVERFRARLPYASRVVNLREYPFQGGCLGCFKCAVSGKCVYSDGFDSFLREKIQTADAMVYAFAIQDHSMGSRFKMYDDRQFCNGHRTVTIGMPVAYLISGDYSRETNLQTVLEGRAQVGRNILAGIATDEFEPDYEIDMLAQQLTYALKHKNTGPQNFLGVGGMKIFRDLIWQMRGFMRADHKFFKAQGQYDFPQKQWPKSLAMYAVGAMIANPRIHQKMGNKMNQGMLMPYKKVLEEADK